MLVDQGELVAGLGQLRSGMVQVDRSSDAEADDDEEARGQHGHSDEERSPLRLLVLVGAHAAVRVGLMTPMLAPMCEPVAIGMKAPMGRMLHGRHDLAEAADERHH